jgi:hypothetical protein
MRWIVISLALGLSACAGSTGQGVEAWKKQARADCLKQTDLIRRETCIEQVDTVAAERTYDEDEAKKKGR